MAGDVQASNSRVPERHHAINLPSSQDFILLRCIRSLILHIVGDNTYT